MARGRGGFFAQGVIDTFGHDVYGPCRDMCHSVVNHMDNVRYDSVTVVAKTQQERKAETRRLLLDAAAMLFADHGIDAVSVDAVADRGGADFEDCPLRPLRVQAGVTSFAARGVVPLPRHR